jgi:lambda family phage portal protein
MGGTHFAGAGYEGAQLKHWRPALVSADREFLPERKPIVSRARELARNNTAIASATRRRVSSAVGAGWQLAAQVDGAALGFTPEETDALNRQIERQWRSYANGHTFQADAQRQLTFGGLLRTVARSLFVDGEAFAHLAWSPKEPCATWSTRVDVIDTDRVSNPDDRMDEDLLRAGVELDPVSRAPMAYWVRERHPEDIGVTFTMPSWRRLARWTPWGRPNFLHVYDRERPGQTRGVTQLAAALGTVKSLEKYSQATLENAVLNALLFSVIKSGAGPKAVSENFGVDDLKAWGATRREHYGDSNTIDLPGGVQTLVLPPEDELEVMTQSRDVGSFEGYARTLLRWVSASVGATYEEVAMDYSTTNYSSARAAMIPAYAETLTSQTLIRDQFAQPVFVGWLEEAIETERITLPANAPDYWDNLESYTRCRWIAPGKGYIDAPKEIQAEAMEVENMFISRTEVCANNGRDIRDVLADQKRELELMREMGLEPVAGGITLAAASAPVVEAGPDARPTESAA